MRAMIIAAAWLAACASPTAPEADVRFRAVGDDFVLEFVGDEQIRLNLTAEGNVLSFPTPEVRFPRWNGSIYETVAQGRRIAIHIRDDRPCALGDRRAPPTVIIYLHNQILTGCGRDFSR